MNSAASNLPALCVELRIHAENGVPVVNSRDVAEKFEKEHRHVLRDIESNVEKIGPDLGISWFRQTTALYAYGRVQPSFDLTRQGFTLLVMGWTGERAMAFKVRYIQAFDEMEAELKNNAVSTDQLILAIREIVSPLAVRFDGQDQTIGEIKTDVGQLKSDVGFIKGQLIKRGNYWKINDSCRRRHIEDIGDLGGDCPCCRQVPVVEDGKKLPFTDFDHFHGGARADDASTWLVCKKCHNGFTSGRKLRDDNISVFSAYQTQRRQLPGRQPSLF